MRLCELPTEGAFSEFDPYRGLAIPIKDLVRYWWNNIACPEAVLEEMFDDILIRFKGKLLPGEQGRPVDYDSVIDELVQHL